MKINITGLSDFDASYLSMLAMEHDVELNKQNQTTTHFRSQSRELGLAEVVLTGILTTQVAAVLLVYLNKTFDSKKKKVRLEIDKRESQGESEMSMRLETEETEECSKGNDEKTIRAMLEGFQDLGISMDDVIKLAEKFKADAESQE